MIRCRPACLRACMLSDDGREITLYRLTGRGRLRAGGGAAPSDRSRSRCSASGRCAGRELLILVA
ncbi:MAG: hypothetical protein ACLSHG_01190, partial [Oscillospiraceae bacterium]